MPWDEVFRMHAMSSIPNAICAKCTEKATHDYIHPNDYGSVQMGRVFAKRMSELL